MSSSATQDSRSDTLNDRAPAVRATMTEINLAKADKFRQNNHENATQYSLLPTAAPANRVLIAGTVVSREDKSNGGSPFWGTEFVNTNNDSVYAWAGENSGHHDDGAPQTFFGNHSPPYSAAAVCKLTFVEEDEPISDRIVSLRPEVVTEVSRERRDQILVNNALATIERATSDGHPKLEEHVTQVYEGELEQFDRTDFAQDALDVITSIDERYA